MTDWLHTLRAAVAASSQRRVCDRLRQRDGYPSETVISQVLNGKYPGRVDRLRDLVEGAFEGATVACPVLGEIGRDRCREHQTQPFSSTNPTRVQLWRACRAGCPHSRIEEDAK